MKRTLMSLLRPVLGSARARLSPRSRQIRRDAASAEAALLAGFSALQQVAGRGDVAEIVCRAHGAELVLHDGRRFSFDPADRLQRLYSLPVTGEFERKETEWVRRHVGTGQWCVDAGGSFGWYAILLAQCVGFDGRVHVFEPIPRTAEVLRGNIARNGCSNVRIHLVALAAEPGEAELFVPDIGVSGSLRLHEYGKGYETFRCPVRRLDDIAAAERWSRLDFLKADIEGAELDLLRGAETTLARWRPLLLLEIQANSTRRFGHEPDAVFAWLLERGYRAAWVSENQRLARVSGVEHPLPDYNFIFVPDERREEFLWEPAR